MQTLAVEKICPNQLGKPLQKSKTCMDPKGECDNPKMSLLWQIARKVSTPNTGHTEADNVFASKPMDRDVELKIVGLLR
jgi:hypothetical protein